MATKYTFDSNDGKSLGTTKRKYGHRRQPSASSEGGEDDPTDGNGSLTYSAASSINSAAGESTDSSLAGIMRVLDVQDSKELAAVLEKEQIKRHHHHTDRSVADSQHSLAYSTDAESHMRSLATEQTGQSSLHGTGLVGTIAGQTSDQNSYDGGNYQANKHRMVGGQDNFADDLMFAPAEHADSLKRRKDKKRRERKENKPSTPSNHIDDQTPRVKNSKKSSISNQNEIPGQHQSQVDHFNSSSSVGQRQRASTNKKPSSKPSLVNRENIEMQEEEDVWYAKWLMFCFPDTAKTMSPKR